jgi:hypothetical protein
LKLVSPPFPAPASRGFRIATVFRSGPLLALLPLLAPASGQAQIAITSLHSAVLENFDALGTAASAALPASWRLTAAGDSTVSWLDLTNVTTTSAQASSGSPSTGGRYNWGQSAGDRAVGFMTSSGYASPNSLLAQFSNATGATITDLTLTFDYERYRLNSSPASIAFFYSFDGNSWTAAPAGDSGAFSTGASAYGFTTPISTSSRQVTLSTLDFGPGANLYLRWSFDTGGANSQGLGLDNFSLTASAIPEPSTYAALGGAAALATALWRRRRSDPGGPQAPAARPVA